jgi:uncharacterized protein (TIRG00374 family)
MRLGTVLQLLVSAALLALLASWVDLQAARAAFTGADLRLVALAFGIATASRLLMAFKWNLLIRAKGILISWREVVRIYYVSSFAGLFLPSTIGGDAVRGYLTARSYGQSAAIVSSILVERLVGLVVLLAFGIAGGLLLYARFGANELDAIGLVLVATGMLAGVAAGTLIALSPRCAAIVARAAERFPAGHKLQKAAALAASIYAAARSYRDRGAAVAAFAALTALENVLPIMRAWLVAVAMGVDVPLSYYFIVVPVALFAVRLPVSFEGLGLREGVFVFFLALVGVPEGVAFSVSITQYLVTLAAILPGALLYPAARRATGERKLAT